MPDELERLQINIEADASGTAAGAAQAKQALHSLQQDAKRATDGIQRGMDKAAQATKSVAQAAEAARKTLRPLAANPVNPGSVQQMRAAAKSAQESVRKTLQPAMANPVNERGNAGSYKKYEFAKMPQVEMAKQAADMTQTAASTAKVARAADSAAKKVREVRKEVERVGRKGPTIMQSIGRSLRSMLIVTAVAGGLRGLIRWLGGVVSADKQVSASLAQVRGNLLSAFAPIYSAIIPAIRTLCSWLATATAWLSSFLGGLFGMSGTAAKDTANNIANIGGAAGGAGKQMKELLGSFDELNKLDRTSGGGGGGGGGGKIEFGEQIESTVNGGSRLQNAFKAVGETVSTFALALGGLKIAQQVAQWLAPLSGIANANAASIGKWGLAITAAVTWFKSLKEVVTSDDFRIKWENIIASDDAWWQKALQMLGFGFESLAASLIGMVTQFFGVSGSEAWAAIKGWVADLAARVSEKLAEITGVFSSWWKEAQAKLSSMWTDVKMKLTRWVGRWVVLPLKELAADVKGAIGGWIEAFRNGWQNVVEQAASLWQGVKETVTGWVQTYIIDPIKAKWEELTSWFSGLSVAKLFGFGGSNEVSTVDINTAPAIASLTELNNLLGEYDGKTVTATVNIREGGGGTSSSGGGRNTTTASTSKTIGSAIKNVFSSILGYASGSLNIPKGDLFIANESGAEMVGTIGGKTAVANQQEISGAIWREMQQYRADGTASGDDIANAVARALNGTAVKVGERQFGTLVVQAVNKNTRQMGRVDFAF